MGKSVRRKAETAGTPGKRRLAKVGTVADPHEPAGLREQVVAVMKEARQSGLTTSKDARIAGRVSSELIERAKARTGLRSDTELVEFALANIAIEDNFMQVFRAAKGTVDPDLDLEF